MYERSYATDEIIETMFIPTHPPEVSAWYLYAEMCSLV